jgi:hypothetical protein
VSACARRAGQCGERPDEARVNAHVIRLWHWKREQVAESGFPYAP